MTDEQATEQQDGGNAAPDIELTGPIVMPQDGGKPQQIVLLLHGVGSDGDDLINLVRYFGLVLPHAVFVAPNAPFAFDGGPSGYQWFSLEDPSNEKRLEGALTAAPIIQGLINQLLSRYGLDESKLAIVGFSQGAMMALHVAPRRPRPVAGVIGYAGGVLGAELLKDEIASRPPVLLMHGNMDPVVPPDMMHHAEDVLKTNGVPVAAYLCPNLGHGLDDMSVQLGMEFLAEMFDIDLIAQLKESGKPNVG